jgi:2-polyprenyl-3-methyl-5-hydroxy-6-metoxy-1,4-benzoquinol methylase
LPSYAVHTVRRRVGAIDLQLRELIDLQQFSDPQGAAGLRGISSANWPLFGQVWPAAMVLAERMAGWPLNGQRIIEIGCGIGLASLVLHSRGADITATDHHPLAREFLAHNAQLNGLTVLPYRDCDWRGLHSGLGRFDLLIASDVLYERDHAEQILRFLTAHARPEATIIISDPGRGHANRMIEPLAAQGYTLVQTRCAFASGEAAPFRGRLMAWTRAGLKESLTGPGRLQ